MSRRLAAYVSQSHLNIPYRTSDGSSSFLSFWNGNNWTAISKFLPASDNIVAQTLPQSGAGLQGQSDISQLAFVPLQDTHSSNSIIENDRMLMVSGSLLSSVFGNVSTALFDGQNFFPYIQTSTSSGSAGFVSALFTSISNFSFNHRRKYPSLFV